MVRPEYSGPALKVVHFDRTGYLSRSDRNTVASLPPECTVPLGRGISEIVLNRKRPMSLEVKFARKVFFSDDLLRNVLAQHNCARVIRCKRTCYTGRFLAQQRNRKGYTKGVTQKIDNTYVTRKTEFVACRRKF